MSLENGCACGKKEMDGIRCRLGATHRPLDMDKKHAFPWSEPQPVNDERKMPWE